MEQFPANAAGGLYKGKLVLHSAQHSFYFRFLEGEGMIRFILMFWQMNNGSDSRNSKPDNQFGNSKPDHQFEHDLYAILSLYS